MGRELDGVIYLLHADNTRRRQLVASHDVYSVFAVFVKCRMWRKPIARLTALGYIPLKEIQSRNNHKP